jgi:hypothetical protein
MPRTFTLKVNCDNAAFTEHDYPTYASAAPELARILREVADKIEGGCQYDFFQTIRDVNGNDVGRFALKPV